MTPTEDQINMLFALLSRGNGTFGTLFALSDFRILLQFWFDANPNPVLSGGQLDEVDKLSYLDAALIYLAYMG